MSRKLFCELGPTAYKLSIKKTEAVRKIRDIKNGVRFAKEKSDDSLQEICVSCCSPVFSRSDGADMELQKNKETNLIIASSKINGIIIQPGETFSFWELVGQPTEKGGFKEGLIIIRNNILQRKVGGGLCRIADLINLMILQSPLKITEFHHHSDSVFPCESKDAELCTGTSVFYKLQDYRFYNNLDYDIQIKAGVENGILYGELLSAKPFDNKYALTEEESHFTKENDEYFRVSKVYKLVTDKNGNTEKILVLNNQSKVMYDYSLIPNDLIY